MILECRDRIRMEGLIPAPASTIAAELPCRWPGYFLLRLGADSYQPALEPLPCFLRLIPVCSARELRRHVIGSWQTMTTIPIATLSVWKGISPRS